MSFLPTLPAPVTIAAAQALIGAYNLAFQVSPIILQGGIAASAEGGLLPIIALYGELSLFEAILDPSQFFATYLPLPGSTLISNTVATYPFANQQVAGNAIIQQPLTLSMLMIAPVNQPGGYLTKLATFTAFQKSLQQHCQQGGLFSVATPAFVYKNLILTNMASLPSPDTRQVQIEYQLDFIQPLITLSEAQAAQNAFMSKVTNGGIIPGTPAWSGPTLGASTAVSGLTGALQVFGGSPGAGITSANS